MFYFSTVEDELETFVDPERFHGTMYRAANWQCVGTTRGYRRVRGGYSDVVSTPKLVFVRALSAHTRARLTQPVLDPLDRHGSPKMMLAADHMRSLPECFADIDDPRRRRGRRHPLPTVLAIATAATLCGARTYQAMAEWAQDLSQRARERFRCRHRHRHYDVPSQFVTGPQLLAIDEVGYLNYDNRYADLLFEVVTRRYLTVPVLITTNKPFSEWADVFSSAACVVTLVDRLIHRSEIVQLDGESYRLREAKEQAAKRSKARSRRTPKSRASQGTRS